MIPPRSSWNTTDEKVPRLPAPWTPINWYKLAILALATLMALVALSDHLVRAIQVTAFMWAWFLLLVMTSQNPRLGATRDEGGLVMGWRAKYRWAFPTAMVSPLVMLLLLSLLGRARPGLVIWCLAGFCAAAWTVLHLIAREEFRIVGARIERRSPWTGRRTALSFASVVRVEWDAYHRFVLVPASGRKLAVFHRIDGIGDFASVVLRQVPAKAWEESQEAKAVLEHIAALHSPSPGISG